MTHSDAWISMIAHKIVSLLLFGLVIAGASALMKRSRRFFNGRVPQFSWAC